MGVVKEILSLLRPHYIVNILLSLCFYIMKTTQPICTTMFHDCELEMKEWELVMFLGCILIVKNRKALTYKAYISTACMFSKILSAYMFARQSVLMSAIYSIACLLHLAFLPEPMYGGPENIIYLREDFEEEIKRDPRITWLICFYAAWSPQCVSFAPVFAELSSKYHLDNLKFGKLDVSSFPKVSERFRVNPSSWSKQLPSLLLFQGGKEEKREPICDSYGRPTTKTALTCDNIVKVFNLNDVYLQCKQNPIKKKKNKKSDLDSKSQGKGDAHKDKTE